MNVKLNIGQIIDVEVTLVEVYGVYCQYMSQVIFINIPEFSWIASYNSAKQFTAPGDVLSVKIIKIDMANGQIGASIRELYDNPWECGQFKLGKCVILESFGESKKRIVVIMGRLILLS